MSHILRKLRYNKVFFAMLILCVIMLPSVIYKTSESDRIAISVMLGIDKTEDDEVELTVMYLTPQSSNDINKNYTVATSSAETVENAIAEMQFKLGKDIGLSHTQAIILSEKVAQEEPLKYLDVFTRTNRLTTNALLLVSNKPKELLETHLEQSTKQSISLITIMEYNNQNEFTKHMNLEQFYSECFDESSVSLVPIINVKKSEEDSDSSEDGSGGNESSGNASSPSSGQQSGSSGNDSSPQGSDKKELDNTGDVAVFVDGNLKRVLKKEEVSVFNLLSSETPNGSIKLENITNKYIKNADLYIGVRKKNITSSYSFVNGYPVFQVNASISFQLNEIFADEYSLNSISVVDSQIDDITKRAILDKIHKDYSNLVNIAKDENIDLFILNKRFHRLWNEEWAEYLLTLDTDDNFMQRVLFLLNIEIIDNG